MADSASDTGMSRDSTVVGSEDGFRMRLTREGDAAYNSSETTGLLASESQERPLRKDSWNGLADFENVPRWRRPSVCISVPRRGGRRDAQADPGC